MRLARDLERKEQGDGKDAQEIVLSQLLTPPCSGFFLWVMYSPTQEER